MADDCIGLVNPGEMGAAVARTLRDSGRRVMSVLAGRSSRTRRRAEAAGIEEVDNLEVLVSRVSMVISIVPPAVSVDAATSLAGAIRSTEARVMVIEANAVSPEHADYMSTILRGAGATFVDADLIGGPPSSGRPATRLYLSGPEAARAALALETPELCPIVLSGPPMAASSLKMAYAAWTKGSTALLLASRSLARMLDVEEALLSEWEISQPDLLERCEAASKVSGRAWRFAGEMEEIAGALRMVGFSGGFGVAAADVYRRLASLKDRSDVALDDVLALLEAGS